MTAMKRPGMIDKLREKGLFLALSLAITIVMFAFVIWAESKLSG